MKKDIAPKQTNINDLVLVYKEDIPQFFARVEDISEDIKPGWFHLKLLILTIPVQEVTWILKDIYIDGDEFSMEGQKMRIEKIIAPSSQKKEETNKESIEIEPDENIEVESEKQGAQVISLSSFKK